MKGVSMKVRLIFVSVLVLFASLVYAQENLVPKTQKEKISYIIGLDIGQTMKKQEMDVSPDLLAKGITDGISGAKPVLSDQEIRDLMTAFQKEVRAKQEELNKKLAEKNKKEGEAFLAENKNKEGVKTLPSGLQYKVIIPGSGRKPTATDTITTQYRGTLIDGTEFDSSYKRGAPAVFPINRVIRGWTEVLPLMEEGAKWQVFIPPHLAYGERGAGREIGPNATLIFEIELISIQNKK